MYTDIYYLECPSRGIFYVGQTINYERRYEDHCRTYGKKISLNVIDSIISPYANFYEQYYISLFKSWGFVLYNKAINTKVPHPLLTEKECVEYNSRKGNFIEASKKEYNYNTKFNDYDEVSEIGLKLNLLEANKMLYKYEKKIKDLELRIKKINMAIPQDKKTEVEVYNYKAKLNYLKTEVAEVQIAGYEVKERDIITKFLLEKIRFNQIVHDNVEQRLSKNLSTI